MVKIPVVLVALTRMNRPGVHDPVMLLLATWKQPFVAAPPLLPRL
jgi:hypothetical protein